MFLDWCIDCFPPFVEATSCFFVQIRQNKSNFMSNNTIFQHNALSMQCFNASMHEALTNVTSCTVHLHTVTNVHIAQRLDYFCQQCQKFRKCYIFKLIFLLDYLKTWTVIVFWQATVTFIIFEYCKLGIKVWTLQACIAHRNIYYHLWLYRCIYLSKKMKQLKRLHLPIEP